MENHVHMWQVSPQLSWWRHQMETFRVTGHLCGEFTGPGEFVPIMTSMQWCCGDPCKIWLSLNGSNRYVCFINTVNREIDERSFCNPHLQAVFFPRSYCLVVATYWHIVLCVFSMNRDRRACKTPWCPRYWPFVRGIHRSPVNSPHKGQWRGALMFSLICVWINGWVNNREAGDLRRYRAHYDLTVMHYFDGMYVEYYSYDSCVAYGS